MRRMLTGVIGTLGLVLGVVALTPPGYSAPAVPPGARVSASESTVIVIGVDGLPYRTASSLSALTPMAGLPAGVTATAVAAAKSHSLVLGSNGKVYGTGSDAYGQLGGIGPQTTLTVVPWLPTPTPTPTPTPIAIAAGSDFSLVLGSDGKVYGAGYNDDGQLTGNDFQYTTFRALTGLPAGVAAVDIAAGMWHSVVRGNDGKVYGTGDNYSGQLTGAGDKNTLTVMTGLPAGVAATAIVGGTSHTIVIGSDGVPYGTGWNENGQLTGAGDRTTLTLMTGLPGGVKAVAAAAGENHSLVRGDDGKIYGTGSNGQGELPGIDNQTTLTPINGLPTGISATGLAAGRRSSFVVGSNLAVYGTPSNPPGGLTLLLGQPVVGQVSIGPATVNEAVVAPEPVWQPNAESYYQWRLNGVVIGGATSRVYTPLLADANKQLSVAVTGTVAGNPPTIKTIVSNSVTVQPLSAPTWVGGRALGAAQVGAPVAAPANSWDPASTSVYRWSVNGATIHGATAATYIPKAADLGKALQVTITSSQVGYATATVVSDTTTVKQGAALRWTATARPVIRGTAKVGKTLTLKGVAKTGFTPAAEKLSYQWLRNGAVIKKATKVTYKTKKADRGKKLSVRIVATRAGHPKGSFVTATMTIAKKK